MPKATFDERLSITLSNLEQALGVPASNRRTEEAGLRARIEEAIEMGYEIACSPRPSSAKILPFVASRAAKTK